MTMITAGREKLRLANKAQSAAANAEAREEQQRRLRCRRLHGCGDKASLESG